MATQVLCSFDELETPTANQRQGSRSSCRRRRARCLRGATAREDDDVKATGRQREERTSLVGQRDGARFELVRSGLAMVRKASGLGASQ